MTWQVNMAATCTKFPNSANGQPFDTAGLRATDALLSTMINNRDNSVSVRWQYFGRCVVARRLVAHSAR